ncbi:hypothetical protein BPAE_0006g01150 [Botrytis paeoniae]|uniref:ZZ-type domain-containing protein n=1 Tax=Botrytis paeoniae TaxID=278948 RepID=A0A4Z1G027_9HELO|nr:hypothetical protein BPAE_0006g01150 [Botrytis paeoniae]
MVLLTISPSEYQIASTSGFSGRSAFTWLAIGSRLARKWLITGWILLATGMGGADADGTDVTNNLFSDLGPLLALFGDTFAQQFLRESFTWLDHIIFAMAPLGILTAIIGAIRVGGPGYLRAVIGRARENKASAELDFMSSTSHEVSELWNGDGIVRTMGKGKIKQIVFLKGREKSEDLGLYTLHLAKRDGLMENEPYRGPLVKELKSLWDIAPKLWKRMRPISPQDNNDPNNNYPNNKNHSNNESIDNDQRKDKSKGNDSKRSQSESNDSDRAPNISLNLHPKQTTWELFVAAILGIILQVGVMLFSGFVAYNDRFGAMIGGRPSAYAFPILASGTAVLVFGMGICALVIGQSTDEELWRLGEDKDHATEDAQVIHEPTSHMHKDEESGGVESLWKRKPLSQRFPEVFINSLMKEGERNPKSAHSANEPKSRKNCRENRKEFLVFWLQKSFIVSDQTFDSYMLMAREEKESVLTSCRNNDRVFGDSSGSTLRAQPDRFRQQEAKSNPNTEANSCTGQLKSSHTSPSRILSSGPVIRESATPSVHDFSAWKFPSKIRLSQSDKVASRWLSTLCLIGTSTGIVGFVLQFEGFRGISWTCSIAQLVAILIMTVVRAVIRRGMLDSPVAEKIQDGYEMDWLALRIGNDDKFLPNLCEREPKDTVCSICGGYNDHDCDVLYWKVSNEIRPPSPKTAGWKTSLTEIDSKAQKVVNIRKRLQELTNWSDKEVKVCAASAATAIEKIMGLFKGWEGSTFCWLVDIQMKKGDADANQQVQLKVTKRSGTEENLWDVNPQDIESIISLWMYHLVDRDQTDGEIHDSTDKNIPIIQSFQRVLGPSSTSLTRDLAWWTGVEISEVLDRFTWKNDRDTKCLSLGFGRNIQGFEFTGSKVDGSQNLQLSTMVAHVGKEKFLAQHIFSTFMWAVLHFLPIEKGNNKFDTKAVLPSDDRLKLSAKVPTWNSLRLTNEKIKQMAQVIEISGLGSLEDAHLLIIPPLSCSYKLPNEGIVDELRKSARDNELGYRDTACDLYAKLLQLCDSLPPQGRFVYKVVSTSVDFLVTAASTSTTKEYMAISDENLEKSKKSLVTNLQRNHKRCLVVLKSLYTKQKRPESFEKTGLLNDKIRDRIKGEVDYGYTDLHKQIIDKKKPLDLKSTSLSDPDILGWTPLHYAVRYSFDAVKELLKEDKELANKVDLAQRTPLHYAVMKQNKSQVQQSEIQTISQLVEANSKPLKGRDGLVPLHWAAKTGNYEAVELLLNTQLHQSTINSKDCWDMTPLHFAALGGHLNIINLLLEPRYTTPALDARDKFGRTVLHVAVMGIELSREFNGAEIVKKLINKGADVKLRDRDDKKAVDLAAEMEKKINSEIYRGGEKSSDSEQDLNQVRFSIKSLLGKENLIIDGGSLLLWAVQNKFETPFNVLIESNKIVEDDKQRDVETGQSILHLAVDAKSDSMVEKILKRWTPRGVEPQATKSHNSTQEAPPLDMCDDMGCTALILAARKGYRKIVRLLLKAGSKGDITDDMKWTALAWAASQGHVDIVTELLQDKEIKANIDARDCFGYTPLMLAITNDHLNVVVELLGHKADPNIESRNGATALTLAVRLKSESIVQKLLNAKADKSNRSYNKRSALSLAAENGSLNIVVQLLDDNADPDLVDGDPERSILSRVAKAGYSEIATLLMDKGATLGLKGKGDQLTTFIAVENGHYNVVKLFLERQQSKSGANEIDNNSDSILCCAVIYGHKNIVKLLIDSGADIEMKSGKEEQTPLSRAASEGNLEIIELLLNHGANLRAEDKHGWTPLICALKSQQPKAAQWLVNYAARKDFTHKDLFRNDFQENQHTGQLDSVIIWACKEGNLDFVKLLLDLDLSINFNARENMTESTPLIEASRKGKSEIIDLLLKNEALVDSQNCLKSTALHAAVSQGHQNIVELLLKSKANINLTNASEETPLFLAVLNKNEDIVRSLLQKHPNVDVPNDEGETPLALAVRQDSKTIAQLLLDEEPNLNTKDKDGRTPLFLAVVNENVSLVQLLLEAGANAKTDDNSSSSPLFQALYNENSEIVSLLLKGGADTKSHSIYGGTPLQEAARWGLGEILKILLTSHAEVNETDIQGRNVFHIAVDYNRIPILDILLKEGKNQRNALDLYDKQGRNVFHHAATSHSLDMISFLLELPSGDSQYHRKDKDGWTPLHWAAQAGDLKFVRKLIDKGIELDAEVRELIKNWTPRQIASYNDYSEIVDLLEGFSIFDEILPPAAVVHNWITCDGCNCTIHGVRYRCTDCNNFDFCWKCKYTSDNTHPKHTFEEIGLEKSESSSDESSDNAIPTIWAMQDYEMQLMLIEQQNKKRLMMARQEQDSIQPRPDDDKDSSADKDIPPKSNIEESTNAGVPS